MRTDTHHELLTWPAKCACGLRFSISSSYEQLLEDYQVHRDVIDEAAREGELEATVDPVAVDPVAEELPFFFTRRLGAT